ncbi:hypothetical protein ABZ769_35350 [Streptomyces olivoreticuli]
MGIALATAVIAVLGTLLGSIVSGLFQHKSADRTERVARGQELRRDQLEAVTALATAISDHRRAMWMRGDAKLKGGTQARIEELRGESHMTRSAVTRPLVALRILVTDQTVRAAADRMVTVTYAMRNAYESTAVLTEAREAAKVAHDDFVDVAGAFLEQTAR